MSIAYKLGKGPLWKTGVNICLVIKLIVSSVLLRAQPQGTLITTFNPPTAGYEFQTVVAGYSVKSLQIIAGTGADLTAGGDILVGGSFISSVGLRRNIIGLNHTTGAEATIFNTARGADPQPNGSVNAIINHGLLGAL